MALPERRMSLSPTPPTPEKRRVMIDGVTIPLKMSPNHGNPFLPGMPDLIVLHYTAGGTLAGAVQTLRDPASQASAHLVVDRDGSVVQLVPFDTVAWHAGKSSWQGVEGCNARSLGIEQVNWGPLHGGAGHWLSWCGAMVPDAEAVRTPDGSYWHDWPEAQLARTVALCQMLCTEFRIQAIVGHSEVALPVGRKQDPGPAFPMRRVRIACGVEG
jgi:N-acetylmuramoyl-L-alanine amidase